MRGLTVILPKFHSHINFTHKINILMPDFQHSVYVVDLPYTLPTCRSRCRSRFCKNRVHTGRLCRCCWGVCEETARQAQEPGHQQFSRAKEWAELQARTNGRNRKIELDIYEWMNGNGELTDTENVIFYVSYKVLTKFLQMNVILTYFATAMAMDTECWK